MILLVKKNGRYVLPKGHLEKDESAQQAALREVQEETGYRAEIIELIGVMTRPSTEDWGERVQKHITLYRMRPVELVDLAAHQEAAWLPSSHAATQMLYAEEGDFLLQYL